MTIVKGSLLDRAFTIAKSHYSSKTEGGKELKTYEYRHLGKDIAMGMSRSYLLAHFAENPWLLDAPLHKWSEEFGVDYPEDTLDAELRDTLGDCIGAYLMNGMEGLERFWEAFEEED